MLQFILQFCRAPGLVKICLSQPDGCDDHHILHTGTWLRDNHSGKCCSKSCYGVELQVAKCKKNTSIDEENDATAGIQTTTRSYLCLRVKGNIVTSPEKDDWFQQTRLWIATAKNGSIWKYFSIFPLQRMHGICCHASVFLIRPTHTHSNTLLASYFKDIDFLVCRPYQWWQTDCITPLLFRKAPS